MRLSDLQYLQQFTAEGRTSAGSPYCGRLTAYPNNLLPFHDKDSRFVILFKIIISRERFKGCFFLAAGQMD